VSYEDRITIHTPEGVDLELPLAGLGSRFAARMIDELIKLAIIVALFAAAALAAGGAEPAGRPSDTSLWALAAVVTVAFLINFFYEVLFETLGSGRTPGKRSTGLRVVALDGRPVTFLASSVRNLLRVIDALPFAYVIGMISLLVSPRNQRLGDLAAGTLVVREIKSPAPVTRQALEQAPLWDVTSVTAEEAAAVGRFLERRETFEPRARARLAEQLATRLRPKVAGAPEELAPEEFLESMSAAKSERS
jgi:uncharacterized RDD family membrane protein YckC